VAVGDRVAENPRHHELRDLLAHGETSEQGLDRVGPHLGHRSGGGMRAPGCRLGRGAAGQRGGHRKEQGGVTHNSSAGLKWNGNAIALAAVLLGCAAIGAGNAVVTEARPDKVRPGIDVLLNDSLHLIRGKRVGLVTNLAAVGGDGTDAVTLMRRAPVTLVALFGPEHGLGALAAPGEKIESTVDSVSRIPIYSLYGATRRPTAEMLRDVEVLVVDLPDVGARYYTYPATAVEVMFAADSAGIPVIIADRPNPIGGTVQG